MRLIIIPTLLALASLAVVPTFASDAEFEQRSREAIKKSLPYLAEKGDWWAKTKKCVSCHRITFQIWTHAEAAKKGFDVDMNRLTEWAQWSLEAMQAEDDKGQITATKNLDGVAQMLTALKNVPEFEGREARQNSLLKWLEEGQQPNGSWKPAGQLPSQKRPKTETTEVTTMWNVLLADESGVAHSVFEKANNFGAASVTGKSTEWLVTRILQAKRSSASESFETNLKLLLSEQNEDGGWGWIRSKESDAMATGQVLYALESSGNSADVTNATNRAVRYLLDAQNKDGSWPTKGTKENRKTKVTETATYWGSAWATIGLLKGLRSNEK